MEATKARAEELGVSIAWNWNTEQEKPPIQMCTAWIMPYIFVSGHVIPCCVGNEANQRELQKKLSLGNVNERSFKEIWDSPEYKEFRMMIRRGETPPQCRDCGVFAVDRGLSGGSGTDASDWCRGSQEISVNHLRVNPNGKSGTTVELLKPSPT